MRTAGEFQRLHGGLANSPLTGSLPIDAPPSPFPGSGGYDSFGRPCPIAHMMLICPRLFKCEFCIAAKMMAELGLERPIQLQP